MKNTMPVEIFAKDYQVHPFKVNDVYLTFCLDDVLTRVTAKMQVERQTKGVNELILNGEEIELSWIKIDGQALKEDQYSFDKDQNLLTISGVEQDKFELEIENTLNPSENKALDGLYKSGDLFCTQNEPEGFRRITFFIDRPDNMCVFTTRIEASKKDYPNLLSNGNLIDSGDLNDGKHFAVWNDPFPKPSYLFALVGGNLGIIKDTFTTMDNREIRLEIYCDKGNEEKCYFAMESLKKSMKWDEEKYGLIYDLDIYMIVAVDAFNMGAMENKGLNIFNTSVVLAKPETATDKDFFWIESVVGHEYFHNWTGNRVTCRDWFQLTLKEGLTVYRDQEFSADLNSRELCRIKDIQSLRASQFKEDAGPMAHPIKPASYMEINNFYTATVYNKGAEIIRMIETFLGKEGFRKGMDKYFELFDGQAVTTEDFIHAMSVANNDYDFSQFKNWYSQAGTPEVHLTASYDETAKELSLTVKQKTRDTKETKQKRPFHFPFCLKLLSQNGDQIQKTLKDNFECLENGFLHIKKDEQTFVFTDVKQKPLLSFNQGFRAPVKVNYEYTDAELLMLAKFETDGFVRYEALQTILKNKLIQSIQQDSKPSLSKEILDCLKEITSDSTIDDSFKALLLSLPSKGSIEREFEVIDFRKIHEKTKALATLIAESLRDDFSKIFKEQFNLNKYEYNLQEVGRREILARVGEYLSYLKEDAFQETVNERFNSVTNMTEKSLYLGLLLSMDSKFAETANQSFYNEWKQDTLVVQIWLELQALVESDLTLEKVKKLETLAEYDNTIPNLVRSLVARFAANSYSFHAPDFGGYDFIKEKILEIDPINPQMASRLSYAFSQVKAYPKENKKHVIGMLEEISKVDGLSKNTFEVIDSTLKDL